MFPFTFIPIIVLHPYGKFLGLWAREVEEQFQDYYGSFIQISVCPLSLFLHYLLIRHFEFQQLADGQLIGVELQPPKIPHLMQPLRPKLLFTISMDETKEDKAIFKCCVNPFRPHLCEFLSIEQVYR